jgi:hypothetical protein
MNLKACTHHLPDERVDKVWVRVPAALVLAEGTAGRGAVAVSAVVHAQPDGPLGRVLGACRRRPPVADDRGRAGGDAGSDEREGSRWRSPGGPG